MKIVVLGICKPIVSETDKHGNLVEGPLSAIQVGEMVEHLRSEFFVGYPSDVYSAYEVIEGEQYEIEGYTVEPYTTCKIIGTMSVHNEVHQKYVDFCFGCLTKETLCYALRDCATADIVVVWAQGYYSDLGSLKQSTCAQALGMIARKLKRDCTFILCDEHGMFTSNLSEAGQIGNVLFARDDIKLYLPYPDDVRECLKTVVQCQHVGQIDYCHKDIEAQMYPPERRIGSLSAKQHNIIEQRLRAIRGYLAQHLRTMGMPQEIDLMQFLMMSERIPNFKSNVDPRTKALLKFYHQCRQEHTLYNGRFMMIDLHESRSLRSMLTTALGYQPDILHDVYTQRQEKAPSRSKGRKKKSTVRGAALEGESSSPENSDPSPDSMFTV